MDTRFLYYSFFSADWRATIEKNKLAGATVDRIPISRFPTFEIALPPVPIQRKIATILSAYDKLIENNMRRLSILEEMARMIFREWFVDFHVPASNDTPVDHSPTGPVPRGWQRKPYSQLLASALGGDWGGDEPAGGTRPVRVIRGTDFDDIRWAQELRVPTRYITKSSLEKRRLVPGDIIVENSVNAKSRCVGTPLLITEGVLRRMGGDTIAASFCKVFRPKNRNVAPLVYLHLRHLFDFGKMSLYQNVAANGIGNFQAKRFIDSEALVLPCEQSLLESLCEQLQDLTSSVLADQIATLRMTHDLLLSKLVTGDVDVAALDIDVAEQTT